MTSIRNVIVGTAGHIDHGKSALVRALTGIEPDRWAEERARGMTIDLGFAPYHHRDGSLVGFIDVPGHERFIRNMVAGATSVDIVLLVVAADDGVMPQTREHLDILRLVGACRGLVVLTKIDLVDEETLELAREDVAGFLAGSFLERAPVLAVSSVTGQGLEGLREELDALISAVPELETGGPFRLPVQRVFSAKGHGTVVTGVAVSGTVVAGDALELVGAGRNVKVRAIQAYGQARDQGRAGHSMALNISGLARDEVRRGDVLATPGLFRSRTRVLVSYRHVAPGDGLPNHAPVRLHAGTAEVMGHAVVLDAERAEAGAERFVQLRLDAPVTVAAGDRYVVRHAAHLGVLGGGVVLGSHEGRLRRFKDRVLEEARRRLAAAGDPATLAQVALHVAGRRGCDERALAAESACSPAALAAGLAPLVEAGEVLALDGGRWVDAGVLEEVAREADAVLKAEHDRQPLQEWLPLTVLRAGVSCPEPVLRAALSRAAEVELASGGRVRRRGHAVRLDPRLARAREGLLQALLDGGATPPSAQESLGGVAADMARALLERMRAAEEIRLVGGVWFHTGVLEDLRARLLEHGRARGGRVDIPALRDEWGTTRKYLIPLLEQFDAEGLTRRQGEGRVLRQGTGHAQGGEARSSS